MRHALSTRLEIDVLQAKELEEAAELAAYHIMPAMVVHQELIQSALFMRVRKQGKYKIIVPIDWPKGNNQGVAKFRDVPVHILEQEGYEILLSPAKSDDHAFKELKAISDLVRYFSGSSELRFCLDTLGRPEKEWLPYCKMLSKIVAPDLIRTDHNTSFQQSKANVAAHTEIVTKIEAMTPRPIKLSGNIHSLKTMLKFKTARFGVSLKQAKDILQELKENPTLAVEPEEEPAVA
jgi:hypothetical protein